ncbi:MAG: gamma-glutamyltransferase [bacterium]|nr:gamma-glutamyltransferase [bacterium]
MTKSRSLILVVVLLSLAVNGWGASPMPVWARNGMVVSANPLASQVGVDILKAGGNAIDAAVATAFALGVVEGYSSGIGGGSFAMLRLANRWETVVVDGREKAPGAAKPDMYVDKITGKFNPELSTVGVLASAVPGHMRALTYLLERYGTMSLGQVLEPAIALADTGFILSQTYARTLAYHRDKLRRFPTSVEIFFKPDCTLLGLGDRLVQNDLAMTYRILADEGESAFYEGYVASQIAQTMTKEGGLISLEDLKSYKIATRRPIMGSYHGYTIYTMPPPSSGGIHLIEMLNVLERYDLAYLGHNSSETIHLLAEAMKFAFADRAKFMGDPDFTEIPIPGLISKDYADSLAGRISRFKAVDVQGAGNPYNYLDDAVFPGGKQTTHFSVIDRWGNMVAMTATINTGFGSGYVVPGTGILLNNEMDDFSAQPGVANYFGLEGSDANAIAPDKRPLSSMTPTFVFYEGEPFLIVGSPGGPRIITTVLQVISNVIDYKMNIQQAVDAPRIHHQWHPDKIYIEDGIPADVIQNLLVKGHDVQVGGNWSAAEAIMIDLDSKIIYGGSDSRIEGAAKGY